MNVQRDKGRLVRVSGAAGILGPVIFVTTFLLDGLLTPGYSLIDRPISDLALTGTYGWVQDANFAALGILLVVFAFGFSILIQAINHHRLRLASSILLVVSGAAYVLVAIFPAQAVGESPLVLHALMHSIGFSAIFLSYGLALLLTGVAFRGIRGSWHRLAW